MIETNENATRSEAECELRQIAGRDLQLWSMGLLVIAVLALGVICLVVPNLLWNSSELRLDGRFLPQLFSGFIALVFLFNLYTHQQKTKLDQMRTAVIQRLLGEAAQPIDTTSDLANGLLGPAYVTPVVDREIKRAERLSSTVSFAVIRITRLDQIAERFGPAASEHLLATAANLLKNNFRGADALCRSKRNEFLVVLPDTGGAQAEIPLARLRATIEEWNKKSQQQYSLEISVGIASWRQNASAASLLQQAREAAEQSEPGSKKQRPAFRTLFAPRETRPRAEQANVAIATSECRVDGFAARV